MNHILCKDVCNLLPLYIDNMLSDEEMTQISEHLAQCSACRKEYELLKGILRQTEELPKLEVSEEFSAKLHCELEKTAETMFSAEEAELNVVSVPKRKRWRIVSVAAACAAAIAVSVIAWNRLPDSEQFIARKATETVQPQEKNTENEPTAFAADEEREQATAEAKKSESLRGHENEKQENKKQENKKREENSDFSNSSLSGETKKNTDEALSKALQSDAEKLQTEDVNTQATEQETEGNETASQALTEEAVAAQSMENGVAADSETPAVGGAGGTSSGASFRSAGAYAYTREKSAKICKTATFYFEAYALEEAKKCMAEIAEKNGKYELNASALEQYSELLKGVEGYLSCEVSVKDYTARYNELLSEQEKGSAEAALELQKIESAISKSYIVIAEK